MAKKLVTLTKFFQDRAKKKEDNEMNGDKKHQKEMHKNNERAKKC